MQFVALDETAWGCHGGSPSSLATCHAEAALVEALATVTAAAAAEHERLSYTDSGFFEEEEAAVDVADAMQDLAKLRVKSEKRRVRFCDEVGEVLATVYVMDVTAPPVVPQGVLDRHRRTDVPRVKWTVTFEQPACNWPRYQETLRSGRFALENAVVSDGNQLFCSFKVDSSLPYERTEVFARLTTNAWASFDDIPALRLTRGGPHHSFTLKIELPEEPNSEEGATAQIAFFSRTQHADGGVTQLWDSNQGVNYEFKAVAVESPAVEKKDEKKDDEKTAAENKQKWSSLYAADAYIFQYDKYDTSKWSKRAYW